jgi:type VI secretion system protein ImpK
VARYVLCTVVDEAVVTTPWGNESEWSQMSLLSSFHNETFGGEKFFRCSTAVEEPGQAPADARADVPVPVPGLRGQVPRQDRGMPKLEGIRDALYRQIRQLRGDVPRELSPRWEGLDHQRRSLVRIVPAWMRGAVHPGLPGGDVFGFRLGPGRAARTVLQPFQPLEQPRPAAAV